MSRTEELLERFKDKLLFVEKKKEGIESLKELIDMEEDSIRKLTRPHLNSIVGQSIYSKDSVNSKKMDIRLYKVVENSKSRMYYDQLREKNASDQSDSPYFWDRAIYVVVRENKDIMALNNYLLARDCQINQGITDRDYKEKNNHLLLYLEVFDQYY